MLLVFQNNTRQGAIILNDSPESPFPIIQMLLNSLLVVDWSGCLTC